MTKKVNLYRFVFVFKFLESQDREKYRSRVAFEKKEHKCRENASLGNTQGRHNEMTPRFYKCIFKCALVILMKNKHHRFFEASSRCTTVALILLF